ncbi:hypothetical protein ACF3OH_01980 [Chryseomicrobium aureum]|uniref:hypothetical protein n=1 Tax=Chryseomicrobium aureum TaxID=1441723 RepID=UPI00370D2E89
MAATTGSIDVKQIEKELPNRNRLIASELRYSKKWQALLDQYATVEIMLNGETVAQLSNPTVIPALLNRIYELENELEQLLVEQLYAERLNETDRKSGDELKQGAEDILLHYIDSGKTE